MGPSRASGPWNFRWQISSRSITFADTANRTFALHQKSRYSINSSAVTGSLSGTVSPILHGLEVDRKFERGRLRYWELRRFGSLENPSSIDVGLAIGIGEACRLATFRRKISNLDCCR